MTSDPESRPIGRSAPTETLKLLYEEVIRESDRLRSARGTFSRQLGPLPIAGALVLGVFTAFAKHPHRTLAWVAVGLFGLSVLVSMAASGIAPYRRLRARETVGKDGKESTEWRTSDLQGAMNDPGVTAEPVLSEREWLWMRIKLERKLYGAPEPGTPLRLLLRPWKLLLPNKWTTLQKAFEVERYAVLLVQLLFLAEIVLLFAAGGR